MPSATARILLIEADPQIRRSLHRLFKAQGYRVVECESGREGIRLASSHPSAVIFVDFALPDMDGLTVIHQLREGRNTPIVVIGAWSDVPVKVAALDAGADDYISQPFEADELLARIRVALRHALRLTETPAEEDDLTFDTGTLHIDFGRRHVCVENREIHLTPIEYQLLTFMAQHVDKVVTYRQLLEHVWGTEFEGEVQYLRVYIQQLRRKLELNKAHPRYLLNEKRIGYRLAKLQDDSLGQDVMGAVPDGSIADVAQEVMPLMAHASEGHSSPEQHAAGDGGSNSR